MVTEFITAVGPDERVAGGRGQAVAQHVAGGAAVRGGAGEGAHGNVEPDREDPGPERSAPEVPVLGQLVAEVVQHPAAIASTSSMSLPYLGSFWRK